MSTILWGEPECNLVRSDNLHGMLLLICIICYICDQACNVGMKSYEFRKIKVNKSHMLTCPVFAGPVTYIECINYIVRKQAHVATTTGR